MASPSVTQSGAWTDLLDNPSTFTSTAITTASDCLWCAMCLEKNASTTMQVNSMSSAGVTWKNVLRKSFSFSGIPYTVELWKAPLGSRTTYGATTVTVNMNAVVDGIAGVFFATVGDFVPGGCTLDPNASLPATGGQASTPPAVTFSTTNPDDLLLWVAGADTGSLQVNPNGWTNIQATGIFPVNQCHVAAAFLSVSAKQTNVTLLWTGNTDMVMGMHAETADAAAATKGFVVGMIGIGAT